MSKNKKTVFVNGALGKMGQSVISACKSNSDLEVKYAVDVPVHPYLHDSIYSERDIKKYKPPNHWEVDLQSNKLWSKYLTFSNTENPVDVKPEIASK